MAHWTISPGDGWFAHFRDPDENVVGLWDDAPAGSSTEAENP
jgi:predicted enzyme related to lactoylglutathione lyase